MIEMFGAKNDLSSAREHRNRSVEEGATDAEEEEFTSVRMPLPSGLSALIQAATSHLGQLAEAASIRKPDDHEFTSIAHSDREEASSEGGDKVDHPARTPTIVPEPDPRRQSFPELLMTLAVEPSNADVITFLPDGKFFAIRSKRFAEEVMIHYFAVSTFEAFLELSNDWGFSRILQDPHCKGIEVFRHPQFIKGDWERASRIKFGESPHDARVHALPERAKIEYSGALDDSALASKRRLSPGFLARRESETSTSLQKQRTGSEDKLKVPELPDNIRSEKQASSDDIQRVQPSYSRLSHSDDIRSQALDIAAKELNLKAEGRSDTDNELDPLVDSAVESATHAIVTDAIESLLRDESHTKETYRKHEKELSTSCIKGVVPIAKRLFSSAPVDEKGEELKPVTSSDGTPAETSARSQDVVSFEDSPSAFPKTKSTLGDQSMFVEAT